MKELIDGVKRILDAANEKLNTFCEEYGIEPDDERLTETPDEETDEETGGEGEIGGENGEEETAGGSSEEDMNTMPTPENVDMAQSMTDETLAMPDAVGVPQAGQMDVGQGVPQGVPQEGAAPQGDEVGGMSPEEDELLKQQMAAQQSQ